MHKLTDTTQSAVLRGTGLSHVASSWNSLHCNSSFRDRYFSAVVYQVLDVEFFLLNRQDSSLCCSLPPTVKLPNFISQSQMQYSSRLLSVSWCLKCWLIYVCYTFLLYGIKKNPVEKHLYIAFCNLFLGCVLQARPTSLLISVKSLIQIWVQRSLS